MPSFNVLYTVHQKAGQNVRKLHVSSGMIQVCARSRVLAEMQAYSEIKSRFASVNVVVKGFEVVNPIGVDVDMREESA